MGKNVSLTASGRHQLDADGAHKKRSAKGAIVVVQEIFGVNARIFSLRGEQADYAAASKTLAWRRTQVVGKQHLEKT